MLRWYVILGVIMDAGLVKLDLDQLMLYPFAGASWSFGYGLYWVALFCILRGMVYHAIWWIHSDLFSKKVEGNQMEVVLKQVPIDELQNLKVEDGAMNDAAVYFEISIIPRNRFSVIGKGWTNLCMHYTRELEDACNIFLLFDLVRLLGSWFYVSG